MSMTVNWSFVPVYSGCVAAGAGWLQVHRELAGRTSYTWRVYNTIIINELQLIANDELAIIHHAIIFNHWEIAFIFIFIYEEVVAMVQKLSTINLY